jgi:hypothetical protein
MSFFNWIDLQRSKLIFMLFYYGARYGLGLGFVLSGARKFPDVRFTNLPTDNPVGLFFEAMFQMPIYWNFIGYYQILCGVLMFIPRLKAVTPLLILPITVNIFLISVALNMRGTPLITSAMLLGNIYLMLWHYEHYLPILKKPGSLNSD